jgi:5-methylcytosine-specific restriction endonuclease McrA
MRAKYSKELLEELVKDSTSVAQVIRRLGLKQSGGNHSHITTRIKNDKIDTSHFLGSRANCGPNHRPEKMSPAQILVNDRLNGNKENVAILRRALLESGILHKCAVCSLPPVWNGKYLQLQIDHINGIPTDNRVENLRFICGNCHLQTENFGIKNSSLFLNKKIIVKQLKSMKTKLPKPSESNPNWRNTPRPDARKVSRPSKEELEKLLWEKPTTQLAVDFGVSDNAIAKWAKSYGIEKPPRGYWAKANKN